MSKRVIISVTNDLTFDQRVHRVAQSLHEEGYQVLLVGREHSRSSNLTLPARDYRTYRMKLLFESGKVFYLEYAFRLFWFLMFRKFDLLNANDLDALLPNFLASRIKGKPLVYDSHEYFTEVPELTRRPKVRAIWLKLEKWIFPKLKRAYTVNESISDIYRKAYGVPVGVVRNLPFAVEDTGFKPSGEKLIIYQGAMNLGRGIDLMIKAMLHLPEAYRLQIIGGGNLEVELRELAKELKLEDRVEFVGWVNLDDLAGPKGLTAKAMVGLSLEEELGLNYRYALPNKLFDYVQARVPVLVAGLPEMRRVVDNYGVGEVFEDHERTPEALAERIRNMCDSEERMEAYRQACRKAALELCWEKERSVLLSFYK